MTAPDIIFAVGSLFFIAALIPSIRGKNKPELSSSVMTGSILAIYGLTYFFLFKHPLYYAGITTLGTSACWFILAWQKLGTNFVINKIDFDDVATQQEFKHSILRNLREKD